MPREKQAATVGDRIREVRREQGLSQAKFAEAIGQAERTVQSWELNDRVPRLPALRKVALLAGRPVSWFYEGVDGDEPPLAA